MRRYVARGGTRRKGETRGGRADRLNRRFELAGAPRGPRRRASRLTHSPPCVRSARFAARIGPKTGHRNSGAPQSAHFIQQNPAHRALRASEAPKCRTNITLCCVPLHEAHALLDAPVRSTRFAGFCCTKYTLWRARTEPPETHDIHFRPHEVNAISYSAREQRAFHQARDGPGGGRRPPGRTRRRSAARSGDAWDVRIASCAAASSAPRRQNRRKRIRRRCTTRISRRERSHERQFVHSRRETPV